MKIRIRFAIWCLVAFLPLLCSNTFAIDCDPLDPNIDVSTNTKTQVEGAARSLLKIVGGEVRVSHEAEKQVHNLYSKYPNADKLVLKRSLIYMFCTMLEDDEKISQEEKQRYFKELYTMLFSGDTSSNLEESTAKQRSPNDADIILGNSKFWISAGKSTSLTVSRRVPFSTYQPGYQGVVGVYINGKRDTLRVGQSRPVPETDCTIWLLEIERFRGPYSFELRCPG